MSKAQYALVNTLGESYFNSKSTLKKKEIVTRILKLVYPYFQVRIAFITIPEQEKEDLVQDIALDTFLLITERWNGEGKLGRIINTNVTNCIRNFFAWRRMQKRDITLEVPFGGLHEQTVPSTPHLTPLINNEKLEIAYWYANEREKFVIEKVLDGYTYREIAKELGLACCTISLLLERLGKRIEKEDRRKRLYTQIP